MEQVEVIASYLANLNDTDYRGSTSDHTDEVFVWITDGWCDDWAKGLGSWMYRNPVKGLTDLKRQEISRRLTIIATPTDSTDQVTLCWMRRTQVVQMSYNPATITNGVDYSKVTRLCNYMAERRHQLKAVSREGLIQYHHHLGGSGYYDSLVPLIMSRPDAILKEIVAREDIKKVFEIWEGGKCRETTLDMSAFGQMNVRTFHLEPLTPGQEDGCSAAIGYKQDWSTGVKVWKKSSDEGS